MIRKIADCLMAPAPGEVRAALPDTPHSVVRHAHDVPAFSSPDFSSPAFSVPPWSEVQTCIMSQLMPLPLTVSCFTKIQIGFTFLVG